ncbi:TIGR00725 family protein [Hoeflea sp. G2-23]|uniref:TIGR00725 family protein n=1 Tax=Hoeflea algicola TaxID=2983763 RepID=A0ABT3ZB94_9HYPH|nr:TIGR00725 family protein [Hoeflea algicola]MCY0148594.1 TIGR00725 family protein [Hoeflea algicola]
MLVTIGVIGKNEQHENDVVDARTMQAAEDVGRLVAEKGGVVVTGGRFGVMEAASRGAKMADGLTIGILPAMDKSTANDYCDVIFPTGLGRARNLLTARSCDALIMIGGSCGTLNELTIAYAEARPVVILRGSGGWADRIEPVLQKGKFIDERETVEIDFADTAEEAVAKAFERATEENRTAMPDRP